MAKRKDDSTSRCRFLGKGSIEAMLVRDQMDDPAAVKIETSSRMPVAISLIDRDASRRRICGEIHSKMLGVGASRPHSERHASAFELHS